MDLDGLLTELVEAARRLGLEVRQEPLGPKPRAGGGGLCTVNGRALLILNEESSVPDRVHVLTRILLRHSPADLTLTPSAAEHLRGARQRARRGEGRRSPAPTTSPTGSRPGLVRALRRVP